MTLERLVKGEVGLGNEEKDLTYGRLLVQEGFLLEMRRNR